MRILVCWLIGIAVTVTAVAQAPQLPLASPLSWPGTTLYDETVPTPEQVLGYRIGERHTLPSQVVRYFEAVAAKSPRVTVREHGLTHEGRVLLHAIVTTAERQPRLDKLAAEHRAYVSGERDGKAGPAVAYMGYSIHGNEASGTEAAILTLYHLAAGQGPAVDSVLENVVTIIDPMFNPDGRDRFVDWVNRNRGGVATTDPQDREHNEPWPNGRTNHYWFDLNRDWLPAQHPESQARLRLFYTWRPQVLTDYHEMGSNATYFFQPGIPSRTNPLTPPRNQELTGLITDYSARALDRIGSLYYTRESFDDFYYGKGSTYPDINGSVGILFEQASSRALEREVDAGTLDYGFTVRNQLAASLATLQATARLGGSLLQHSRDFYAGASAYAKTRPFRAYLIPLERQRSRALELANLLTRHQIEVYRSSDVIRSGRRDYAAGEALVIPVDQPQTRLLEAAMEPNTMFRDSLFYDVSTWTLPLAFDLEVDRLSSLSKQAMGERLVLAKAADAYEVKGELIGDAATAYALVMPWDSYYAPRAAYRILSEGGHARLVHDPISFDVAGNRIELGRGSLVIPLLQNPIGAARVRELANDMVARDGVRLYAVASGLTPSGPDLGGRSTQLLAEPKVALLTGRGANPYQAGEAWHLLSERLDIPVSLLDIDRVGRVDLDRYTHIAMTGGNYGSIDEGALRKWVSAGGTLIASHTAANYVAGRKKMVDLEEATLDVDSLLLARDLPYAQLDEARGAQYVGGAILDVELDATHPLTYGIGDDIAVFRQHSRFWRVSAKPGATVGTYADRPLSSGYLSPERRRQASGRAAIVDQPVGRGRVILFFDDPLFRAFWRGSERLWLNAILLR